MPTGSTLGAQAEQFLSEGRATDNLELCSWDEQHPQVYPPHFPVYRAPGGRAEFRGPSVEEETEALGGI